MSTDKMDVTVRKPRQPVRNKFTVQLTQSVADELEVIEGDYVKLQNNEFEIACEVELAPRIVQSNVIFVNHILRQTLQVESGSQISIEPTTVYEAESLTVVTDAKEEEVTDGEILQTIRNRLLGVPIMDQLKFKMKKSTNMNPFQQQGDTKDQFIVSLSDVQPQDSEFVILSKRTKLQVKRGSVNGRSGNQAQAEIPDVTYSDIGGLNDELERVREMIELPLQHQELFQHLGVEPPTGVILHGSPGTGKTLIAKAVANEVGASFHSVAGPEIMSKHYGGSEEQLREVFEEASENSPAIIFIDELDSIASSRSETTGDVEQRIVAQLLTLMDGLEERENVIVIGATNRLDAIDNALRRGGRFDREIEIGIPDKDGRKEIFEIHTRGMPLEDNIDLEKLADTTYGFVGADIATVTKEAAMAAIRRIKPDIDLSEEVSKEVLDELTVTKEDFKQGLRETQPSAMREVFVEIPDVTWNDVGGLNTTKAQLQENIEWPLKYEQLFDDVGLDATTGVLLYGPPGTGKTLLAKAVANESDVNFISIKGPELLNKYVGESEKGVRDIFSKARENAPTVVFFDELDAIATERGSNMDSGVSERVVSQLLTELDGLENLEDVMVIATSNRPELIDNALLRPGRIDRQIHVPVPDQTARKEILSVHTQDNPLTDDVDLEEIAEQTEGYVGADIASLCRTATMNATRNYLNSIDEDDSVDGSQVQVTMDDFMDALTEVSPSVTPEMREEYEDIEVSIQENTDETKNNRAAFQ